MQLAGCMSACYLSYRRGNRLKALLRAAILLLVRLFGAPGAREAARRARTSRPPRRASCCFAPITWATW